MTTENHHPITDEDIRLYLCDALSPDRRAEIRRWFGTEEGQRYLSEIIDEDVARILSGEELHSSESIEIQPLHIEIPTEKSKKRFQPTIGWWLRSIAIWIPAILLLATGGYMYYNQTQSPRLAEIYVPKGDIQTIIFQDGTKVILNADSRLKYTPGFKLFSREVELEGEAYFKVKSNPRWPMYITCKNNVVVQVVGTEFNLTTYANDDNIKLLLVSGKLDILDPNNKRVIKVQQNEEVTIYDLSEAIPEKGCPVIYNSIAWKEGLLIFDNTLMSEVVKRLERWYGVQIEVENKELLAYRFTATFKSESLDRVLNVLKISSDIDYQINDTLVRLKL